MGPGWKRSALCAVIVALDDHAAHDVGGHEIGRELDARILEMQHAAEGAQQRGLAEAGHAFEQNVAAGEQADQDAIDDVLLADDDLADFLAHLIEMTGGELECRTRDARSYFSGDARNCLGVMYYNTRASCRPTNSSPDP